MKTIALLTLICATTAVASPSHPTEVVSVDRLAQASIGPGPQPDWGSIYSDLATSSEQGSFCETVEISNEEFPSTPSPDYAGARAFQCTKVTNGLHGESIISGWGKAQARRESNLLAWMPRAKSELAIRFTSACDFNWTLDYGTRLIADFGPIPTQATVRITLWHELEDGPADFDVVFNHTVLMDWTGDVLGVLDDDVIRGQLPAGTFILEVSAQVLVSHVNSKEDDWGGIMASWNVDFFTECDLSKVDFGRNGNSLPYSQPWPILEKVLGSLGMDQFPQQADLDQDGDVDVDDVIDALTLAVGHKAAPVMKAAPAMKTLPSKKVAPAK